MNPWLSQSALANQEMKAEATPATVNKPCPQGLAEPDSTA